MFNVIHKHKGSYIFFVAVRTNGDHPVYLSAYGQLASALLEKYIEDQRDDNKELFDEWDKSLQKASSQAGFAAHHEVEGGYVYIITFQNGLGVPLEDEAVPKKRSIISEKQGQTVSLVGSDLDDVMDEDEDSDGQ